MLINVKKIIKIGKICDKDKRECEVCSAPLIMKPGGGGKKNQCVCAYYDENLQTLVENTGEYYNTDSEVCEPCSNFFNFCKYCDKDQCIECFDGYAYNDNKNLCEECKVDNCGDCSKDKNKCEECIKTFYTSFDKKTCLSCINGCKDYFLNI